MGTETIGSSDAPGAINAGGILRYVVVEIILRPVDC